MGWGFIGFRSLGFRGLGFGGLRLRAWDGDSGLGLQRVFNADDRGRLLSLDPEALNPIHAIVELIE